MSELQIKESQSWQCGWDFCFTVIGIALPRLIGGHKLSRSCGRKLQFIQHEEGRIVPDHNDEMTYQYHLKDHLGNTRTTFTTGKYTSRYIATMEDENHEQEAKDFYNITNRVPYPIRGKAVRLNSTSPIGPALGLEVSRGDTINISVKAYYENTTGHGTNSTSVAALAAALTGAYGGLNGGSEAQQLIHDIFNKHAGAALAAGATRSDTHPSAYLNYLMFDTEYNLIASQTGYVGIDGTLPKIVQIVNRNNLVVEQAGYVYIYVSNESQSSHYVFFDNLDVSISESPILETTDYYPFGLTFNQYAKSGMVGQRFKYNGKEEINDLGLNWMDYGARMYMPDLGRWGVVDALATDYYSYSPYNYSINNPIRFIDPDGNGILDKIRTLGQKVGNAFKGNGFKNNYQVQKATYDKTSAYLYDVNSALTEGNQLFGTSNSTMSRTEIQSAAISEAGGDPYESTISEKTQDVFEVVEGALESKGSDNAAVTVAKKAGDLVYGMANDPYGAVTGESLGGAPLGASGREDAITGLATTALKPLKYLKGVTKNLGQFMKGRKGMFSTSRKMGDALLKSNGAVKTTRSAIKNANQAGTVVSVVDKLLE